jgi:hypothetical protein
VSDVSRFEPARKVADAVLYEGYLLYPYRASSTKNQIRWQFGVLTPRTWSDAGSGEPWASQTECLIEPGAKTVVHLRARFLQVRAKIIEQALDGVDGAFKPVPSLDVDGDAMLTWDDAEEREIDAVVTLTSILDSEQVVPFDLPGDRTVESISAANGQLVGRTVVQQWPLSGQLRISAERVEGPYGVVRLRVRLENVTGWNDPDKPRDEALRSFVAAHALLSLDDGRFISLLEHPEWAGYAVAECNNLHTYPVLVGENGQRDLMLSSPLILYDYPTIAPESQGDLFDATEIDEILLLRTMTLTDDEKREARATDPRAASIVDRADMMPPEMMDRLHGTVRYLREITGDAASEPESERLPWWDPGVDASVSPDTDSVEVDGIAVARGSTVRLNPGARRADAQDMFLIGRIANVEAVLTDIEDKHYLAVTLLDDPGADLQQAHGRFLYFAPEEVVPLEGRP